MDQVVRDILIHMLTEHEGKRRLAYDDANGKTLPPGGILTGNLTIGIGRNLSAKGLHEDEIRLCLSNDITEAERDVANLVGPTFYTLSPVRQAVLINMAFNMGGPRLAGFTNTLQAVRDGNFKQAANGMRASKWARQVGKRAEQLARIMENG